MSVYLNFVAYTVTPFVIAHPAIAVVPAVGFGLYKGAKFIKNKISLPSALTKFKKSPE